MFQLLSEKRKLQDRARDLVDATEVERQQILSALEQTGWHRGRTAELLGISPSTVSRALRSDPNVTRETTGKATCKRTLLTDLG